MRSKGKNDTPITTNLPRAWVDELDALASVLAESGAEYTRSDVLRMALRVGMDKLAADADAGGRKKKRP